MSDGPILLIGGFGRCGTTLAMTMLDAGGFPVTGPRPAYELSEHWRDGRPDLPWLNSQSGRAVKWIDPSRAISLPAKLNEKPAMIFLHRDPGEQARSQLKILGWTGDRRAENVMKRAIIRDRAKVVARLRNTTDLHEFAFESFIAAPRGAASVLDQITRGYFGRPLDTDRATKVVLKRPASCLPDLTMENTILPELARSLPDEVAA